MVENNEALYHRHKASSYFAMSDSCEFDFLIFEISDHVNILGSLAHPSRVYTTSMLIRGEISLKFFTCVVISVRANTCTLFLQLLLNCILTNVNKLLKPIFLHRKIVINCYELFEFLQNVL